MKMIEREQIQSLADVCDSLIINGLDEKKRFDVDTEYVCLIQQDLLLKTKGLYPQMILAPDMIGKYEDFVRRRTENSSTNCVDTLKIELANKRIELYKFLLQHLWETLGVKK